MQLIDDVLAGRKGSTTELFEFIRQSPALLRMVMRALLLLAIDGNKAADEEWAKLALSITLRVVAKLRQKYPNLDTDEVVSNVQLRLVQMGKPRLLEIDHWPHYLTVMAVHSMISLERARRRRRESQLDSFGEGKEISVGDWLKQTGWELEHIRGPVAAAEHNEMMARFYRCLASVGEANAVVLLMRTKGNLDREIGRALGVGEQGIGVRYKRGLQQIRGCMGREM